MNENMETLSPQEIEKLTGFRQPARQESWMREHGINCLRNARNEIIVLRSSVHELLTKRFFNSIDVAVDVES